MNTCLAEMHAHFNGRCLGVLTRCDKPEGHSMHGWHRNEEKKVRWDYDSREDDETHPYSKPGSIQCIRCMDTGKEDGCIHGPDSRVTHADHHCGTRKEWPCSNPTHRELPLLDIREA